MTSFTTNLKRLRKEKGATQDDLAQWLHVTRQTVSSWETGRCQPDIEMLMALAQALDADLNELIYGTKPGEYPKYQRKYVIWTAVCGVLAAVAVLFWIVLTPFLERYTAMTYDLTYSAIFICILPVLGWFSVGALLPSALALVYPVRLKGRKQKLCRIIGPLLGLPGILVTVDVLIRCNYMGYYAPFLRLFSGVMALDFGRVLLLMFLPFLSGLLIFIGANKDE